MDETSAPAPPQRARFLGPQLPGVVPTITVIICVIVFLAIQTSQGETVDRLQQWGWGPASAVWHGKVWLLVTSAFVHTQLWHLAFNVYWLWQLGQIVEQNLGRWKTVAFILGAAAFSSAAQLLIRDETGIGFSGVGYSLFGFLWVAKRHIPAVRERLTPQVIGIFVIWFFGIETVGPNTDGTPGTDKSTALKGNAPGCWWVARGVCDDRLVVHAIPEQRGWSAKPAKTCTMKRRCAMKRFTSYLLTSIAKEGTSMKKLTIKSGTTRTNRCGPTLSALALVCLAVPNASASDQETFTTIDVPGASSTAAAAINSRGDIVGAYNTADGMSHGFLLRGDDFTSIDFPGASFTSAEGINPRGDIVGNHDDADGRRHGYLLSHGSFTTIDFPGASLTSALGINARGDIVGRTVTAGMSHGYLLSHGSFTTIDFPGASFTHSRGINPRGEITGYYISAGMTFGYLLSGDEFTSIRFPDSSLTITWGINPRGDIVGYYISAGMTHGFLLGEEEFTSIDFPGASLTIALGINPRGDIVGLYDQAGMRHGFLLSAGED